MKKFIAILISVCVIFSFAACGDKKDETIVESVKDPVIQLTENLPVMSFAGTYEAADLLSEDGHELMYALKGKSDAAVVGFVAYSWKDDGELLDIANKEIEEHYKDQNLTATQSNTFFKEGDYDYVSFTAEDSESFGKETTVTNYIFKDGKYVYKLQIFN